MAIEALWFPAISGDMVSTLDHPRSLQAPRTHVITRSSSASKSPIVCSAQSHRLDTDQPRHTKQRYRFPHGDFERFHRCAVLSAESHAAQRRYADIQSAAAHLHGMLDALLMSESRAAS